jgi:uncharacterized membrane protein YadS
MVQPLTAMVQPHIRAEFVQPRRIAVLSPIAAIPSIRNLRSRRSRNIQSHSRHFPYFIGFIRIIVSKYNTSIRNILLDNEMIGHGEMTDKINTIYSCESICLSTISL